MTGVVSAPGYARDNICDACHVGGFAPCKCRVYPACGNYRPAYVLGTAVAAALATLATNTGVM